MSEMKKCLTCGEELAEGQTFCGSCGTKLNVENGTVGIFGNEKKNMQNEIKKSSDKFHIYGGLCFAIATIIFIFQALRINYNTSNTLLLIVPEFLLTGLLAVAFLTKGCLKNKTLLVIATATNILVETVLFWDFMTGSEWSRYYLSMRMSWNRFAEVLLLLSAIAFLVSLILTLFEKGSDNKILKYGKYISSLLTLIAVVYGIYMKVSEISFMMNEFGTEVNMSNTLFYMAFLHGILLALGYALSLKSLEFSEENKSIVCDEKSAKKRKTLKIVSIILAVLVGCFALLYGYAEYQSYKENERISELVEKEFEKYEGIDFSDPELKEKMENIEAAIDSMGDLDNININKLKSANTVYVVYDLDKGLDKPYFRIEGTLDVSDSEKYVPTTTINGEFIGNLTTKAFSQQEFVEYLQDHINNGLQNIRHWDYNKEFSEMNNQDSFMAHTFSVSDYLN